MFLSIEVQNNCSYPKSVSLFYVFVCPYVNQSSICLSLSISLFFNFSVYKYVVLSRYLYVSLPVSQSAVCLSVCVTCPCVCVSVHLSVSIVCACLSICHFCSTVGLYLVCLCVCLFSICQLNVCHLSVWFSVSPFSVFLLCQSLNCLSTKIHLSVCFCISLSVYLSNRQFVLSIYFTMSLVLVSFFPCLVVFSL